MRENWRKDKRCYPQAWRESYSWPAGVTPEREKNLPQPPGSKLWIYNYKEASMRGI